jgi:RNA methyltransferase, TrmH family
VIERPKSGPEVGGGRNGAVHKIESGRDGVLEWAAECQARGDGGRQSAASPVSGRGLDARMAEAANAGGRGEDVDDRTAQVASLDQDRTGSEPQQCRSGALHRGHVMNHAPREDRGLIDVGRHQGSQGKQVVADDFFGLDREQTGAGGRDHDWVHDQRSPPVFPDGASDATDNAGLRQHAGLERGWGKVFGQRRELRGDHRIGDGLHRAHPQRILRREGDDDRGTEDAELLEGLEVGLDAGAAAGVRAGNRERDLHRVSISMSSSLQTLIRDLHRRRGRERRGLALAEGVRLVEEALATSITVRSAAVSPALEATIRGKALKAALLEKGVRVEEVSDQELDGLTDTEHPQGIVAVIEPKEWSLADIRLLPGVTALVLDGVQDPGNVGTMLRTALGLGAAGLVALKGTADLTNPKVLRGGMGASFRLPAVPATPEELVAWARLQRAQIWVADMTGESPGRLPQRTPQRPPILLVVGNEGAGVSPIMDAAADRRIGIGLAPGAESLNVAVAAGILLHEVARAV